jgi:hypothetical protein
VDWLDSAVWGETSFEVGDRLALKPGLRVERYGLTGEGVVDPRLSLHQKLTDSITLRQALGRYHQPPTPGDVDKYGGHPRLQSSYVDGVSLGLDSEIAAGWSGALTGYFSYGQRVGVRADLDETMMSFTNLGGLGPTFELLLEKQLGLAFYRENSGRSRNMGLELLVKHSSPRWFGMLAYTLSRAERTDDPMTRLGWRPFELDQRHNLNVAASYSLTHWRLGARVQLVSGTPATPPLEGNLPVFFQLDVRADRKWPQCWGDVNLYIDIQNATNRRNVEGRAIDMTTSEVEEQRGLPIAPFIGVEMIPK